MSDHMDVRVDHIFEKAIGDMKSKGGLTNDDEARLRYEFARMKKDAQGSGASTMKASKIASKIASSDTPLTDLLLESAIAILKLGGKIDDDVEMRIRSKISKIKEDMKAEG